MAPRSAWFNGPILRRIGAGRINGTLTVPPIKFDLARNALLAKLRVSVFDRPSCGVKVRKDEMAVTPAFGIASTCLAMDDDAIDP